MDTTPTTPAQAACTVRSARAEMTDDEFWEDVAAGLATPYQGSDPHGDYYDPDPALAAPEPCPECGELGACAYDAEGRALIHATEHCDD